MLRSPQKPWLTRARLSINPDWLLGELEAALDRQIAKLRQDDTKRENAATRLRAPFTQEFAIVQEVRRAL